MIHKTQGWKIAKQRGKKKNRISPFAPSKKEIAFYQKYINMAVNDKKLPKRALILGATPELRDSAIKLGLESYAADASREMMSKFSVLMKYKNHKLDKRIIKNWLKIKFPKDYFGIILGDGSFNNLAVRKDNSDLAGICGKTIKKGGYLVLRQLVYTKDYDIFESAKKMIDYYRKRKLSWGDFFMELRFILFRSKIYNTRSYQYDSGKAHVLIDKLFEEGFLNKQEYNRINKFRNNVINTLYPDDKFIRMIESRGFKLIDKFHDKPFRFFKYLYVMVFRRV